MYICMGGFARLHVSVHTKNINVLPCVKQVERVTDTDMYCA